MQMIWCCWLNSEEDLKRTAAEMVQSEIGCKLRVNVGTTKVMKCGVGLQTS